MIQFFAEWYYLGFWRVSMPGLGLDYFACVWKEGAKDADLPFVGMFRFRQTINEAEQWYQWTGEKESDEEDVIRIFSDTVAKIREEAGGGETDYIPIHKGGEEAYELLLEQPWTYKIEPPTIITGQEPNLDELLEMAKKSVDRLG